jgi:hypothetical protein
VFVGEHLRVVSHLRYQDHRPGADCIGRWVFAAPPDDDRTPEELRTARRQFAGSLDCSGKDCFTDLQKFGDWISDDNASERKPLALLMLGHYSNKSFSFTGVGGITGLSIARSFRSPSIAIVNACGTAAPVEDSFIFALNLAGFKTIVGTSLAVDPVMAGQYVRLLGDTLRAHARERDYTVSLAHDDVVRSLIHTYGPRALLFTMMGNGSLRLCAPPKP